MSSLPLSVSPKVHGAVKTTRREPVVYSVYVGRERLGRYVHVGRRRFEAFDALDRPLGAFKISVKAFFAIGKAWRKLA